MKMYLVFIIVVADIGSEIFANGLNTKVISSCNTDLVTPVLAQNDSGIIQTRIRFKEKATALKTGKTHI